MIAKQAFLKIDSEHVCGLYKGISAVFVLEPELGHRVHIDQFRRILL